MGKGFGFVKSVFPAGSLSGGLPPVMPPTKQLAAHQLAVLFSAGNPERTQAAPDWRPVTPSGLPLEAACPCLSARIWHTHFGERTERARSFPRAKDGPIMRGRTPEISTWTPTDLRTLCRAKAALDPQDAELIEKVFDSYRYLAEVIGEKSMSIGRLQKLLFGAKTEKTDRSWGSPTRSRPFGTGTGEGAEETRERPRKKSLPERAWPKRGGGVSGRGTHRRASRVASRGRSLPGVRKGTLYEKRPAVVVRITGQAPLSAKKYELERLRCGLCGKVFTAELPQEAGHKNTMPRPAR